MAVKIPAILEHEVRHSSDLLLQRYLLATDPTEASHFLEELCQRFVPAVREIVSFKLRSSSRAGNTLDGQESEDVCSDAVAQLIARLADLKANDTSPRIENLRSYVAVVAYHACAEHLRRKYPQRYRLKHKVRYVLTHHSRLAFWETNTGDWVGGLSEWQSRLNQKAAPATVLNSFREGTNVWQNGSKSRQKGLIELLQFVFAEIKEPIELDQLVSIVAEILGVKDHTSQSSTAGSEGTSTLDEVSSNHWNVEAELQQKRYLQQLWREVEQLTPRHATALLLNLRDGHGGSALELFVFTGVVRFGQIARVLSLREESLAEFWNDLPLDDTTIARRLGVTRQQVVNLRKSTRERLARRMKAAGY